MAYDIHPQNGHGSVPPNLGNCPLCGQLLPNGAEAARIQAMLDADERARQRQREADLQAARSEGIAATQPQIAALTGQLATMRGRMDTTIDERVGEKTLQIEARYSSELTLKAQEIARLNTKIVELNRIAAQQPVQKLGEIGELEIYAGLKAAYPQDTHKRVPKGQAGADLTVTVMYKGEPAATALLEVKNVSGWREDYVPKLLQNQLDAGADFPLLVTRAFPSGLQPHPQPYKGVLLCPPEAVIGFMGVVRGIAIRLHLAKAAGRDTGGAWTKICALFAGNGRDLLASLDRNGAGLRELDRKLLLDVGKHVKDSNKIHDAQAANLTALTTAIDDIIGGDGD